MFRFITLAIAFNIVWMSCFYLVFVSFLPLIAELNQSQERSFFKEWWNASTIGEFRQRWNLPVHRWCVTHIYVPIKFQFNKIFAVCAVFLASAILHEYMISCPIQVMGYVAFVGFMVQPFIIVFSQYVKDLCGWRTGNLLVWSLLVFGNTVGVVVYYRQVLEDF